MIYLRYGNMRAGIVAGELVSLLLDDFEYMHGHDEPGWSHSDTEMFPVIGPTEAASYRVQVPRGNAIQDQHGMLRDMAYQTEAQTESSATFVKKYKAGTRVRNAKFPARSATEWLIWPFDFTFHKHFRLEADSLTITFTIDGEKDMPYMLGYHPAFKLRSPGAFVRAGDRDIPLAEIMAAGSRALPVMKTREIALYDERVLRLETTGFSHFMLWTEVPDMLCIEPITFYPYEVDQKQLHEGFEFLKGEEEVFSLRLKPMGQGGGSLQ